MGARDTAFQSGDRLFLGQKDGKCRSIGLDLKKNRDLTAMVGGKPAQDLDVIRGRETMAGPVHGKGR